jgi:hypothetical protein
MLDLLARKTGEKDFASRHGNNKNVRRRRDDFGENFHSIASYILFKKSA